MRLQIKQIGYVFITALLSVLFVIISALAWVKYNYPISNSVIIEKYANEFGIDSNLVRAVIKVESGYNTLARSKKGAVGLMQIMPETAKWIAGEFGEDFSDKELFNPEINIKYGCFYLKYLFIKYDNLDKVLFAYNAGEGTLLKIAGANDVLDVYSVKIDETRNYIFKVKKAISVYEKLLK